MNTNRMPRQAAFIMSIAVAMLAAACTSMGPPAESATYNTLDTIAPPGVWVADYLPLPEGAYGPTIPEVGYLIEEINGGVYWVTEGTYQLMVVVTDEGVVVADAPPTIGENILAAIASVTDQPITHVIYSHSHKDHIGAASIFPADAEIIAHAATAAVLERAQDPGRPVPTVTFEDAFTLEIGGKRIELTYPGNNHEPGNIFIHVPDEGVIMFIDVIFPGWMPWRRLALAQDVHGFIARSHEILELEWETLISGHVTRLGTREDVEIQNEFIADLQMAAGTALGTVAVPDVMARMIQRGGGLFRIVHRERATEGALLPGGKGGCRNRVQPGLLGRGLARRRPELAAE